MSEHDDTEIWPASYSGEITMMYGSAFSRQITIVSFSPSPSLIFSFSFSLPFFFFFFLVVTSVCGHNIYQVDEVTHLFLSAQTGTAVE